MHEVLNVKVGLQEASAKRLKRKGEVEINVRVALPESKSVLDIKICHEGIHSMMCHQGDCLIEGSVVQGEAFLGNVVINWRTMGRGEIHNKPPSAIFVRHYPERGTLEVGDRWWWKGLCGMTVGHLLSQGRRHDVKMLIRIMLEFLRQVGKANGCGGEDKITAEVVLANGSQGGFLWNLVCCRCA